MSKKTIKTIEDIYGGYASENFVENLRNTAREAKIRIRHHLDDLVHKNSTDDMIGVCVEAESFWKLIEEECNRHLNV